MLYQYRCEACKEVTDAVRSVAERDDCPECKCGGETHKIISSYRVHSDLTPYYDDNLQCHIDGKQHRQRVMKAQGVEEYYGAGWYTSKVKHRRQA